MQFKDKLKLSRKNKKLTQAELANLSNISLRTIINYEKGITRPQNRDIYSILAKVLEVSDTYLYNEDKNDLDNFIKNAENKYGYTGKKQAEKLVDEFDALFSGGELSDKDKDGVMKALQDLYWKSKEDNARKYSSKEKTRK